MGADRCRYMEGKGEDVMTCPFCGKEMERGIISGDGRSWLVWKPEGQKLTWTERLVGKGRVTAAGYKLGTLKIDAFFCAACKKMIFDTDVGL